MNTEKLECTNFELRIEMFWDICFLNSVGSRPTSCQAPHKFCVSKVHLLFKMSESQPRRRVSYTQQLHLWEFLNNHREVAVGYNKSAQAREHSKRMWEMVGQTLNSSGEGAIKSASEWSKYWVDLKAKIKRKNRLINDARRRTGGGPSVDELSEIEQKFLTILGTDYGSGLPGIQVQPIVTQENEDQPSTSGSSQPIYLEVESSDNNINQEVSITINEDVGQQVLLAEPSAPSLPSIAEFSPPANQPNVLPSPGPRTTPVQEQCTRQRRQRQGSRLTAQDARLQLVAAAQTRAQAELANSHSIARAVDLLGDVVSVLTRIEARLARTESHND